MMLLVMLTAFHGVRRWKSGCAGCPVMVGQFWLALPLGKLITSLPLICCNLKPPPLPLSAELPWIRFALMARPGPAPALGETGGAPGGLRQSWSVVRPQAGSASGAPMISRPPPLATMVGLVLWL